MENITLAFFNLGPMELLLILGVAIVMFGPKRLPEIGEAFGKTIKSFKAASNEEKPALKETNDKL